MKKIIQQKIFIIIIVVFLNMLILPNKECLVVEAGSEAVVKKITSVDALTGNKTIKLAKGKKATLKTTVTVTPNKQADKKVTYKSSNKKIATVTNKGVITGKKTGSARITVTSIKSKKIKAVVAVKVVKGKVRKIKFGKTSGTLTVGETKILKPNITVSTGGSKEVVWKTSNKKVATVNKNGKVKAVGAGAAIITVKAADGTEKKATYKLTVKKDNNGISFAKNTVSSLYVGDEAEVRIICDSSIHGKVSWKSSNRAIVDVWGTQDNTGRIYAQKAGTATITATVDNKRVSRKITVKDYKPKYDYEVNFFNPPYTGINIMYIKTDNPSIDNFRIGLYNISGENTWNRQIPLCYPRMYYQDLKFDTDCVKGFYKVDGGYAGTFFFTEAGKFKVGIEEPVYNGSGKYVTEVCIDMGYIDIRDFEEEKKTWMQSVIDEVTTSAMTKKEKMKAIERYMYTHSVYAKTPLGGKGYIYLAAEEGIPFWKFPKYEFDSFSSPGILTEFGEMIDYPVKNLYYKYDKGTPEWNVWHHQVEAEDGSHYSFCHTADNVIDTSTIQQIDLSKWNYYKCYQ